MVTIYRSTVVDRMQREAVDKTRMDEVQHIKIPGLSSDNVRLIPAKCQYKPPYPKIRKGYFIC